MKKPVRYIDFLARVKDEIDFSHDEIFVMDSTGGRSREAINLNHQQMILVGMRESKSVRKRILKQLEGMKSQTPVLPQTFAEALQLAADQAKQLEAQAPKVAFVENLVERKTLMTATQVGQKHKISAIKLNRMLDDIGGIYSKSVKRSRTFCQSWIDGGLGEMKQTELGHSQALFTPAGEVEIARLLTSEGLV